MTQDEREGPRAPEGWGPEWDPDRERHPLGNPDPATKQPPPGERKPWLRKIAPRIQTGIVAAILLVRLATFVYDEFEGVQEQLDALAPCTAECLERQLETANVYNDPNSCEGSGKRVCIVPIGAVSAEVLFGLVKYYEHRYGLKVAVLPPVTIDASLIDRERSQVSGSDLLKQVLLSYRRFYDDPNVRLLGLTPIDMYTTARPSWRFAFSVAFGPPGEGPATVSIISYARMDPRTYGLRPEPALFHMRLQKMANQQIGEMYYEFENNDNPKSALYNNILSPRDLDRMEPHLPIPIP